MYSIKLRRVLPSRDKGLILTALKTLGLPPLPGVMLTIPLASLQGLILFRRVCTMVFDSANLCLRSSSLILEAASSA